MPTIPIPGFSDPFSSLSHLIGAGIFLALTVLLVRRGAGNTARMVSLAVFGLGAVLLLSISGTYHLLDPKGKPSMMPATAANKDMIRSQLPAVIPDGGTDHMLAIRTALAMHTEVIFFLTDADLMTSGDVAEILATAGSTRIQCIEFGRGTDLGTSGPLRRLATATGGTYIYHDVTRFPRELK